MAPVKYIAITSLLSYEGGIDRCSAGQGKKGYLRFLRLDLLFLESHYNTYRWITAKKMFNLGQSTSI